MPLMDLDPIAAAFGEERRSAVASWLQESLTDCASCGKPVTRISPRRASGNGLEHMDCSSAVVETAPDEPVSAAVAARARRSDWG